MANSSNRLFLSVSTKNHVSGIVRASLFRHPDTPAHPIIRLKPLYTTAGSLVGRAVLNAPIKMQRKRPRHEPDSESDGDDSDSDSIDSPTPSTKRLRRVDSVIPSSAISMRTQNLEFSLPRSRSSSVEPFPLFESLPDPYTTAEDLKDLIAFRRPPLQAAGDLLLRSDATLESGFTERQVAWATFIVESLLLGARQQFFSLIQQCQYLGARINVDNDANIVKVDLSDDPIIQRIAATGCWVFREDTSPHAGEHALEDLTTALFQLRDCIGRMKWLEVEMMRSSHRRH